VKGSAANAEKRLNPANAGKRLVCGRTLHFAGSVEQVNSLLVSGMSRMSVMTTLLGRQIKFYSKIHQLNDEFISQNDEFIN
jgi:hypothetical protein